MIDRNSAIPLHKQISRMIRNQIASGKYQAGDILPSEKELGQMYQVSRYPLRQALNSLSEEGFLERTRGKGTFVRDPAQDSRRQKNIRFTAANRTIALVMPTVHYDYPAAIVSGFVSRAASRDYAVLIGASKIDGDERITAERMVRAGAAGLVLFAAGDHLADLLQSLASRGIYASLIDRNPGLEHVDFISTDHAGGGYMAARHFCQHHFHSAAFAGEKLHLSSVRDRLDGFRRGLAQYQAEFINPRLCGRTEPLSEADIMALDYSPEFLVSRLERFRSGFPIGIFCMNDGVAIHLAGLLQHQGYVIGKEIGLIGFDNTAAGRYLNPPLTTVDQNGALIGETAADLAIQRLENGERQSVRHILPTQIIIRKSCGEG
ncbi:MAG TPA: hypothetical protein DD640_08400 [Clostridiales bacterium]|nr:hypothetical protein [Clostridiales bacterium]